VSLSKQYPSFRRNVAQDGGCLVFLDCLTIEKEGTRFPLHAVQCLAKDSESNPTHKLSGSKFRTFQMYSLYAVFSKISKIKVLSSPIRH